MQSNIPNLDAHFYDYLKRRGITDEVMSLFNIQTATRADIGDCIKIPISDTHAKYRRDPLDERKPKYLYDSGSRVTLFGYDKLQAEHTTILITEGELDCLVAWSHNIPAVTSTGGAMSFQEEWKELLAGREVAVCFDNDDAGAEGMVRVLKYLPEAKIVLVPEHVGLKDISDYVAQGGDLHQLLATAQAFPDMTSVIDDRDRRKALKLPIRFHDKYIEEHRQRAERATSPNPYTGTDEVLRARSYPMDNLIAFTHKKAVCPWHNERTGSLAYYPKTNSAYCFGGCGRAYDSIDAYRKLHNCSFREAITELNKLV
jgi:DNA primase